MPWTEHRTAIARKLWAEGFSASRIANRLGGVSRNAVIGKLHRMGLTHHSRRTHGDRAAQIKRLRASKGRPKRQRQETWRALLGPSHEPRAPADLLAAAAAAAKRVGFADLEDCHCRFPLWEADTDPRAYCGQNRHASFPYCLEHARIAYRHDAPVRPATGPMSSGERSPVAGRVLEPV